jgi:hypothetical protein
MKKQNYMLLTASVMAGVAFTACSSDDDDAAEVVGANGIVLHEEQPTTIHEDETITMGQIDFTTRTPWSAEVTTDTLKQAAPAPWLILGSSDGQAGETSLNYIVRPNSEGKSRDAYVVLTDENSNRKLIHVVQDGQTASNAADGSVTMTRTRYSSSGKQLSSGDNLLYNNNLLGGEKYLVESSEVSSTNSLSMRSTSIDGNKAEQTYYDMESGALCVATYNVTSSDANNNILGFNSVRTVGSSVTTTTFTATYDSNGYIKSSSTVIDGAIATYTFSWDGGNLVEVNSSTGAQVKINYKHESGLFFEQNQFDLTNVVTDVETLNSSMGGAAGVWGVIGRMGKTSTDQPYEIVETIGNTTKKITVTETDDTKAEAESAECSRFRCDYEEITGSSVNAYLDDWIFVPSSTKL